MDEIRLLTTQEKSDERVPLVVIFNKEANKFFVVDETLERIEGLDSLSEKDAELVMQSFIQVYKELNRSKLASELPSLTEHLLSAIEQITGHTEDVTLQRKLSQTTFIRLG